MIADVVRAVADVLSDGSTGVNTLLASVPQDAPALALPNVTVYDSTRSAWVLRGNVDAADLAAAGTNNLLLVCTLGETDIPLYNPSAVERAMPTIIVRYVARGIATDTMALEGWHTLRAAMRCLLKKSGTGEVWPARNTMQIDSPQTIKLAELWQDAGDAMVVACLILTMPVLDPWALNLS